MSQNYINITDDGGIQKLLIKKGASSISPISNSEVLIKYTASYDQKIFEDYSKDIIYRFTIGKNEVIKGLELAVLSMTLQEKSKFIINPKYAYNELNLSNIIPKNAIINLEIELLKILEGEKDIRDMDYPEKLSRSKFMKLQGDNKFKQNDFLYAKHYYLKGIKYLEKLDIDDDEQEDGINLLCNIISNLCNCFNKLKDNNSVIEYANQGINIKKLPKYFYFRAIAYTNINEIDMALNDINILKDLLKKDKKENDEGVKFILNLIENKKNQDINENKKFSKNLMSHNKYN